MSDKSFGDNANRNIVKNPLLSTAVTGLTFEDLTHNAVLVPVAPYQGQTIESDHYETQRRSLANTDSEFTHVPKVDQNLNTQQNILSSQSSSSYTHAHSLDSQTGHHYDKSQKRQGSTDTKVSSKSEDDFDVNEYFARLQGTRYVSAPINSHPDSNANLVPTEDNLEEINLNDEKTVEVQQSLTADIAHNLSQLPNVLPHVANTVFSSFSNMWSTKNREQTSDDKVQSHDNLHIEENQNPSQSHQPQSYIEVKFQGDHNVEPIQYQESGINLSNATVTSTEDVVKKVAPPPREPSVCGTSNFRISTKKKYAQIPGLATKETQSFLFSPVTQNVPSYFIPSGEPHEESKEKATLPIIDHASVVLEQKQETLNETSNPLNSIGDNVIRNSQSKLYMSTEIQENVLEDKSSNNLQNQMPVLPPPPMFSSERRHGHTGKSVLPPSIARRIGTNNPVIKQQIIPPSETFGNIFVPTFDPTPNPEFCSSVTGKLTSQIPTYDTQVFANVNDITSPLYQEKHIYISPDFPPQIQSDSFTLLPTDKSAPKIESVIPVLSTSRLPASASDTRYLPPSSITNNPQSGPFKLPPSSSLCSPSVSVTNAPELILPAISSEILPPPSTTIDPLPTLFKRTVIKESPLTSEISQVHSEPPRPTGSSNFRMVSKRPQYYSGPIEGIGSISNSIKSEIPTTEPTTFKGVLFTPEQTYSEQSDIDNGITATALETESHQSGWSNKYPSYDLIQPPQDYGQQYSTAFDFSRSPTDTNENKDVPKESKGFGIIGSLKSKLSNLDINKIQNSVTTFFDPSYNDTIKATEHATYESTAYDSLQHQTQSNFEIFVPNVMETQPYGYNYQTNQPSYEQEYQTYSYPYFEKQVHDIGFQPLATNVIAEKTQNSNNTPICPVYNEGNNSYIPVPHEAQTYEKVELMDIKDKTSQNSSNIQAIIPPVEILLPNTGLKEKPLLLPNAEINPQESISKVDAVSVTQDNSFQSELTMSTQVVNETFNIITGGVLAHGNKSYESTSVYSKPRTSLPTSVSEKKFRPDASLKEDTCKMPPMCTAFEMKPETYKKNSFDSSKQYDIPNYRSEKMSWFPNVASGIIDTQHKRTEVLSKTLQDTKINPDVQSDHLLESLTKGDIPLLAVSSVPLFGLSTIISDKEDCESKTETNLISHNRVNNQDSSNRNVSISFFEEVASNVTKDENIYRLDKTSATGFFDKDDIKMGVFGAHIKRSESFTGDQKQEGYGTDTFFDNKAVLYDDIGVASKTVDLDFNKDVFYNSEKNNIKNNPNIQESVDNVTELNICETCREVNKPEGKDTEIDDLTTQLIENITSPIQLSNAVEVPLTEDSNVDRVEFDAGQCEEISHITEETIETIHVMSATELLEDNDIKSMNYGWTTDENFGTNQSTRDCGFNVKPIGVFGGSLFVDNVPANASDELKAEFKYHEDLLPRQMSIPSAPPAEDFKSDVAGILDVQSIELDAKQDFGMYEEFVIEPSETDDDKIECKEREKTEESELDSFTNRVEKFKKMEEVSELGQSTHIHKNIEMPTQTITMASYFDTGNYAAETHYKNTISSPYHVSIPPGFEEEFKKRLVVTSPITDTIKVIPSKTVKTVVADSTNFSADQINTESSNLLPVGFDVEEIVSNIVEDKVDAPPSLICDPGRLIENFSETSATFSSGERKISQASPVYSCEGENLTENTQTLDSNEKNTLKASNIFASGEPAVSEVSNIFTHKEAEIPIASYVFGSGEVELPKASNLFASMSEKSTIFAPVEIRMPDTTIMYNRLSSNIITPGTALIGENAPKKLDESKFVDPINFFTQTTVTPTDSFNRLASYFSSPPKTEHAKSFFELSQSQNHYRHEINNEKYKDLFKDLTSVQNLAVHTDQLIRHVNYFTVEYDIIVPENKGDSKALLVESDNINYLSNCRYCTKLIYNNNFKVKTAVNDSKETGNTASKMENVSTTHKQSVTVHFDGKPMSEETDDGVAALTENRPCPEYSPVKYHWFYRVDVEEKSIWRGFSFADSKALETSFLSPDLNEDTVVATDGGRYDVNIVARLRIPIYWSAKPTNVRRCSWFYKGTTDPRYVPYTESVAEKLEKEYQHGVRTGQWHRRLLLPNGEVVVMHGPTVMMHFLQSDGITSTPLLSFGKRVYRNPPKITVTKDQPEKIDHLIFFVHGAGEFGREKEKLQSSARPRVVRRGYDDSEIEDAEPSSIDHLLLLCHGVGSACDMRFRSVEEVVEDFRSTSLQLVQSHYRQSVDRGIVSRVEVLPISWHSSLHSGETGVDRRLAQITLDSIPRLRNFTNDTVLDVLFYTSNVYSQTITNTVCEELNRIYNLFLERNPGYTGGVSLGGHSLGSVILYDLLCHQMPANESHLREQAKKTYVTGPVGTDRHCAQYPKLKFEPEALYALGSPIAIFECIRGVESLGRHFSLPTCKNFFNIFHPYDPIAYRIEPLIHPELRDLKPYLIPHHKGRKRMHLELKDTMARVGADLKQKLVDSLRSTWNKWKAQPTDGTLEKVVEEDIAKESLCDTSTEELAKERELSTPAMLGRLNDGRRVDYVLQETPLEMINEYLFAMRSHVGYWESEDTMLLMLREIYSALGVEPDSTVPQQSLTVERTRAQDSTVFLASDNPSTSGGAYSRNTDNI